MVAFVYGVLAYVAFVFTALYAVGFVEGGFTARSLDGASRPGEGWVAAVVADTVLLGLFAVQHTLMGRPVLRSALAQVLRAPVERSTHVLVSSLFLMQVVLRWKPIPFELWNLELHPLGLALEIAACAGWVIAFAATFQIDHLALFGLAQVIAHARGDDTEPEPARFELPYLYRWVRHPIYFGLLAALWCAPVMTIGHLYFAGVVTAWVVFLARLEERDLAVELREYRAYQARVPMLLPRSRPLRIRKRAG